MSQSTRLEPPKPLYCYLCGLPLRYERVTDHAGTFWSTTACPVHGHIEPREPSYDRDAYLQD